MSYVEEIAVGLLYVPACKTYIDLRNDIDRSYYNLERVRSYVEKNPSCLAKQIEIDLELSHQAVTKALKILKEQGY